MQKKETHCEQLKAIKLLLGCPQKLNCPHVPNPRKTKSYQSNEHEGLTL